MLISEAIEMLQDNMNEHGNNKIQFYVDNGDSHTVKSGMNILGVLKPTTEDQKRMWKNFGNDVNIGFVNVEIK